MSLNLKDDTYFYLKQLQGCDAVGFFRLQILVDDDDDVQLSLSMKFFDFEVCLHLKIGRNTEI